ncbi:transposase domain-containing protein [Novipirellula aureliae]|nr:transposase domain-containing protein [Novipirellula aureliae]
MSDDMGRDRSKYLTVKLRETQRIRRPNRSNNVLKRFKRLHGPFKTGGARFQMMADSCLRHDRTDEIVSQQVRPYFFVYQISCTNRNGSRWRATECLFVLADQGILESRMQGKLARPVWGWGPGETPGPTPLSVGSPRASQRAAILTSLIASCKNLQVEPWAYLKDTLKKRVQYPSQAELTDLLPDRWLAQNPSHQ